MKQLFGSLLLSIILISHANATTINGGLVSVVNGGFESGDFSGWDISIPIGESEFYGWRSAGSTEVIYGSQYGNSLIDGSFVTCLGTGNEYFFG